MSSSNKTLGFEFTSLFSDLIQGKPVGPVSHPVELTRIASELQAFQLLSRIKDSPEIWAEFSSNLSNQTSIELDEKTKREVLLGALVTEQFNQALTLLQHRGIPVVIAGDLLARAELEAPLDRKVRPLRSCEFWVGISYWTDAIRALTDRGFEIQGAESQRRNSVQLRYRKGAPVTLFYAFTSSSTSEQIQRIATRVRLGEVSGLPLTVGTLSPLDRLLKAAMSDLDLWAFVDADRLIRKHDIRWEDWIWELAESRMLASGWFLLEALKRSWSTPIPSSVLRELKTLVNPRRRWNLEPLLSVESWLAHRSGGYFGQPRVPAVSDFQDGWFERFLSKIKLSPIASTATHTPTLLLGESLDSKPPNVLSPRR